MSKESKVARRILQEAVIKIVEEFVDNHNPDNSIDMKIQLYRDAEDALSWATDHCEEKRFEIGEAAGL